MHTVRGAVGNVAEDADDASLLHGDETVVFIDANYHGANERLDAKPGVR